MDKFQENLRKYAELAVKVGVNIQEDDGLLLFGSADTLPLARMITREAYKAGAKDVHFILGDEEMALTRYQEGKADIFGKYPKYKVDYIEAMYKDNYHHMLVHANDPNLLKDIDGEILGKDMKARAEAMKPLMGYRMGGSVKWNIVAMPNPAWARSVFPNETEERAIELLWDNIFKASRVDTENPVQAWQDHNAFLKQKEAFLNGKGFEKLVYQGPGTDLEVYLVDDHLWMGGASMSSLGAEFMPNIPTEEVFTSPHRLKVNGTLKATKPLSYQGKLVDDFGFVFKDGKVVDYYAKTGKDVLKNILSTDEGANYLGEVAIVPHDSPISNTGILFNNTLYDENASCHFAVGMAYPKTVKNGQNLDRETLDQMGVNDSKTHVDFMVGGPELSITGYTKDGEAFELFKNGNWAF